MEYVPPWKRPYFIGIAGCSGSGKTTVTSMIVQKLNVPWTVILPMDNFYKPLTQDQRELAFKSNWDFDAPESIDFDLLLEILKNLKEGKRTEIPVYSFLLHDRTKQTTTVYGANVVILEGIYALYDPRVLDMLDLKVFVQEDYDVCMARRLHRDILYRGRELELSIQQWHRFVKPNFLRSIQPTEKVADIVMPKGMENVVALDVLMTHIRRRLEEKSAQHLKELEQLGKGSSVVVQDIINSPEYTTQVQGIYTILLDRNTSRADFVFYSNRLADILISLAIEVIFENASASIDVTTPMGVTYTGIKLPFEKVVAVTMVRGGELFERALKSSIPTIKMGRLLIQSDARTGEPQLHVQRLPPCLDGDGSAYKVLLTDAQIVSGSAMVMAVKVLVDHGVLENNIVLVTYGAPEIGIRRLHAAFPKVNIVVGRVAKTHAIFNFDRRYYGT